MSSSFVNNIKSHIKNLLEKRITFNVDENKFNLEL